MLSNPRTKLEMIYVISNPIQAKLNLYKVGRHSGSAKKLLNRYSTAIPNLMLYCSYDVQLGSACRYEKLIHKKLTNYRLVENGRSEWFQADLLHIVTTIIETCKEALPPEEKEEEVDSSEDPEEEDTSIYLNKFIDSCLLKSETAKVRINVSKVRVIFLDWLLKNEHEDLYELYKKRGGLKKLANEMEECFYDITWSEAGNIAYLNGYSLHPEVETV